MSRNRAILLLVVSALLWSLGGVLIKSMAWDSFTVAGMRSGVAALVLVLWCRQIRWVPTVAFFGAAICYAGTVVLFVTANKLTTAANAIVLQYTAPFYVGLCGWWYLRERPTMKDWFILFVALGGVLLFFLDELTWEHRMGNFAALASGVCFGWMTLFLRKLKGVGSVQAVFYGNLLAFFICLPAFDFAASRGIDWGLVLFTGTVQLAIPYLLFSRAIVAVTALEAITIPLLEPILNPIWVFLVIGEMPGPMAIWGSVVVLGAVILRARFRAGRSTTIRFPPARPISLS